jgi:hypothetical protein
MLNGVNKIAPLNKEASSKILACREMQSKFKRLAIISDCVHMRNNSGDVLTENHIFSGRSRHWLPVLIQQLICCPFITPTQTSVTSAYTLNSIRLSSSRTLAATL